MAVNESNTIQYTITTTNTVDGTVLYWKTTGNTTNSDISGGNTGSITITNNRALLNVAIAADANTDGTKTIGISLSTTLNGPPVINTASDIIVNDTSLTPILGFTSIPSSINEGSAGTFNVNSSLPNATTAYWTINNVTSTGADFSAVSGSFVITGGVGSFTITPSADASTEGAETFTVSLRQGSISGTVETTSSAVTINDTSLSPVAYIWGDNSFGELGLNDQVTRSSPVQLASSSSSWSKISTLDSTVAVKTNGTLWSWGRSYGGQLGQNDQVYRSSPVQIGAGTTWSDVTSGFNSTHFSLKTDGSLWGFGYNYTGQLITGNRTYRSSPVQIGTSTWSKISAGAGKFLGVQTNGTLWVWGSADWGQLGDNTTGSIGRSSPIQIGALTNWSQVFPGGSFSAAIKSDGTLWAWGYGGEGQSGQNDRVNRSSPVQIGSGTTWTTASMDYAGFAIKSDGTLWSWGDGSNGGLGQNDRVYRSSPTQIGTGTTWSAVSTFQNSAFALKTDGTLWAWGKNDRGQLGLNDRLTYRSSPVQVGSSTNWTQVKLKTYVAFGIAS
jgi:alpha-tubulin suppressor-like RCC1 family protein